MLAEKLASRTGYEVIHATKPKNQIEGRRISSIQVDMVIQKLPKYLSKKELLIINKLNLYPRKAY